MSHETITSSDQLRALCDRLIAVDRIGIDTEFVSEDTFRPELCLIQIATSHELAVIDPFRVRDLTPFWQLLASGQHVTIAHSSREELNFSLLACGKPLARLFDTQIAASFCSNEFPASYGSVVARFLDSRPAKGEQRTDWRRRPLTDRQIDYALEDVRYLLDLHNEINRRLASLQRLDWLAEEMSMWITEVQQANERPRWQRVSGIGSLSPRSLAIVRELSDWRQQQAEQRDMPPRRVLRDDLIVEIAKRNSGNLDQIRSIRGMERSLKRGTIDEIAACVRRGLEAELGDIERGSRESMPSQLNVLGQFLSPALSSICRSANVATSLVGTASDVRDLIAYRLGFRSAETEDTPPVLARGWRAELVGHLIEELLAGKKSIRIVDPLSEHPLSFDPVK